MRSAVERGRTPPRSSCRIRAKALIPAGDPARTPTNFETDPPASDIPRRRRAVSSGAVSSSWMSKRLMSVLAVIGWLSIGGAIGPCLWGANPSFTLLLAGYLPDVSYSAAVGKWQPRRWGIRPPAPRRFTRRTADMVRLPRGHSPAPSRDRRRTEMADSPNAVRTETADDVVKAVKDRAVRFIRLWFTDVLGQLKSFSINAAELDDAFEGGMGFDGSSITGFNPIEESDMIAMPDPSTFAILPWRPAEKATGRMFCDVRVPGGDPYEGDPRWILQRALKRASDMGFDTYNIGPELEYFYFRSAKPGEGTPETLDEGGYFDLTTLDAGSDVRRETILALEQLGIHVEYAHHEVGPSQHEVDMRYKDALAMSDDCMTYRIVVKEYAMKYEWHATFMPKPLYGENGSGMHVHQSLSRDGRN